MKSIVEYMSWIAFKDPVPVIEAAHRLTEELVLNGFISERRAAEILKNSKLPSCGLDPDEYSDDGGWFIDFPDETIRAFHAFEVFDNGNVYKLLFREEPEPFWV